MAWRPSASVLGFTASTWRAPAALLLWASAASFTPRGSAAMILIFGFRDLAARAIPEIIPPPEIGTTMASRPSSVCSISSSPMVAWPQIVSLALNGATKWLPFSL